MKLDKKADGKTVRLVRLLVADEDLSPLAIEDVGHYIPAVTKEGIVQVSFDEWLVQKLDLRRGDVIEIQKASKPEKISSV